VPASWQRVLAALGVAWSLLTAGAALRAARALPADPMARLEREFRVLVTDLPSTGVIGYLERYEGGGAVDAVQMHYAAQYALAPRIVVARTGSEFVIVASGTERPGGDARLDGYVAVTRTAAGHRVFRRLTP
jgi:hypothetical protein